VGFQRTCPSDNFRTLWQTKHKVDVLLTRKPLLIGGIKYHFQMVLLVDPHFGTRIVHIPFRMSPRWFPTVGTAFALKQDVPKAVWRDAPGKVSSDVCWWLAPKKGATVRLGSLNVPIEHHPTKIGIWSMPWLLWLVMSFIYPKWDRQTNPCQTWMFSIVFHGIRFLATWISIVPRISPTRRGTPSPPFRIFHSRVLLIELASKEVVSVEY